MRNASKGTTKAFYIARALQGMEIGEPHSRHCLFVSSTHQTVNGADFQLSTRRNYAPNYSTYWSHAQKPTLFWWVEKRVEEECAVVGGCVTHISSFFCLIMCKCVPARANQGGWISPAHWNRVEDTALFTEHSICSCSNGFRVSIPKKCLRSCHISVSNGVYFVCACVLILAYMWLFLCIWLFLWLCLCVPGIVLVLLPHCVLAEL